ncbi:MAG TPA: response regulator transcription factor [Anaerolineae bacterium]|nr:response regulator transcription factor [Anaerolineae bacterium]
MSEITPIRVMLVDDHAMVRGGLRLFLSNYPDLAVVAEAGDGQEAIGLCPETQPDVILMDIVMPVMDGPTATTHIRRDFPQIQVIALTSFLEEDLVQDALRAGAISYLVKDVGADKLAEAIRAAYRGRGTIDPAAAQILVQAAQQPPPPGQDLTDREREVLALLVEGQTNRQIAQRLSLTQGTVRIYVSNVLSKLQVSNRTEAATLALQHNLVPGDARR